MRFSQLLCVALVACACSCIRGENYYNVLGLKANSSYEEIKKTCRKLRAEYHPDKTHENREAALKKFLEIGNACDHLTGKEAYHGSGPSSFESAHGKHETAEKEPNVYDEEIIPEHELCKATQKSDAEKVKKLIEEGVRVNYDCGFGETPLWRAVANGNVDAVEMLIRSGANPNVRDQWYKGTPLLVAIFAIARPKTTPFYRPAEEIPQSDWEKIVELLIKAGANVNAEWLYQTPLDILLGNNSKYGRPDHESPKVLELLKKAGGSSTFEWLRDWRFWKDYFTGNCEQMVGRVCGEFTY